MVVQTGRDANGDGMLETSEVGSTQEICTAPTPTLTTVLAIAGGDVRCPIGGTAVETGLDANGNGILDPSEITTTDYECLVAPDGMDIQAFTPPAAVPNQPAYTINLSGGASTTGDGGNAGSFIAQQLGSTGRHFAVWPTGVADASFTIPAVAPSFGARGLDVAADTTLTQDDGSHTPDGGYYIGGNTLTYRQDATHLLAVTGLHVAAGKTLTLPVELSQLPNDISIEGTVVAARNNTGDANNLTLVSSSLVSIAATGKVDASGAAVAAARGGNSGRIYLQGGAVIAKGPLVARGAAGASTFTGGGSNGVEISTNQGGIYVTAAIDTRGGAAGDAAAASNGGNVYLHGVSSTVANSGSIDTRGGDGTATGVAANGGNVTLNGTTSGFVRNSGTIDTSGGNTPATCTATTCNGGSAGVLRFDISGGSVATSGDVTQRGGTGGGGSGGNGGYTEFQFNTAYGNSFLIPAEGASISGNYRKEGGSGGTAGGIGGSVGAYGNADYTHSAAQFQLFGYTDVTANGGPGTGGGRGGDVQVSEQPSDLRFGFVSNVTGSALLWFANVSSNGGTGTANSGGDAGNISLRACDYFSYLGFGCLVENRGSITANGGAGNHHGGASGIIQMKGQSGIANVGALTSHAGAGHDQPGGDAQNVQFYAFGPVSNSGAIDLVAGDSDSGQGGNCDGVQFYGSTITNTGAITEAGGSSTTGAGGNSNQIAFYSSSALTNTGVLAAPGGAGTTAGVDGVITFNNLVQP